MRRLDPSTSAGSGDEEEEGEGEPAECPYCGSTETHREHPKGPGLCRSIHFCTACEQPFERFG